MKEYEIRRAEPADLETIMKIYAIARNFMAENGNPTQWCGGYPQLELLKEDIEKKCLYTVCEGKTIRGVFYFVIGEDPTYTYMEQGQWRSNTPYGTIHRIAADGSGGIFSACLAFCNDMISHLRIDTHQDNIPMQRVLAKYGFSRRGIIYVADGTSRIAYDRI